MQKMWDGTQKKEDWVKHPRYNTRSQMKAAQKREMLPDPSLDVDGDGAVSAEDFKRAMEFDQNGDGVLQTTERRHLRQQMVDEAVVRIRSLQQERQILEHDPAVEELISAFDSSKSLSGPGFDRMYQKLASVSWIPQNSLGTRETMHDPSMVTDPQNKLDPHWLRPREAVSTGVHTTSELARNRKQEIDQLTYKRLNYR
jgi:hypothetical protein